MKWKWRNKTKSGVVRKREAEGKRRGKIKRESY